MDDLNIWGLVTIKNLQRRFREHENVMSAISNKGDASYVFGVIFPIVSSIDSVLASNVLLVTMVTEWLTIGLKWLVKEDRPFWWVRETDVYRNREIRPFLKQNYTTCEASAGTCSEHVALCAALCFTIAKAICDKYKSKKITFFMWGLCFLFVLAMGVSRVFSAAHFPHQCAAGALLGFTVAYIILKAQTSRWGPLGSNRRNNIAWLCFHGFLTLGGYWIQKAFGQDPHWSTKMAFKWCQHYKNVSVITTPVFSLTRDIGLSLGLAYILPIVNRMPATRTTQRRTMFMRPACVLACCTALYLALTTVPTDDARVFYTCQGILHSLLPVTLLGLVPKLAP